MAGGNSHNGQTAQITTGSPPASGAPGVRRLAAGSNFPPRAAPPWFPYREHRNCAKWIGRATK